MFARVSKCTFVKGSKDFMESEVHLEHDSGAIYGVIYCNMRLAERSCFHPKVYFPPDVRVAGQWRSVAMYEELTRSGTRERVCVYLLKQGFVFRLTSLGVRK